MFDFKAKLLVKSRLVVGLLGERTNEIEADFGGNGGVAELDAAADAASGSGCDDEGGFCFGDDLLDQAHDRDGLAVSGEMQARFEAEDFLASELDQLVEPEIVALQRRR